MANKDITESGVQEVLRTMGIPTSFQGLQEGITGRAETLATLGTGMGASAVGGLAGLAELARTGDLSQAVDMINQTQQALTYMPRSQAGIETLQSYAPAMEALGAPSEYVGETALELTGSPAVATGAEIFGDPYNFIPGLKGIAATVPLARKVMKGSKFADPSVKVDIDVPQEALDSAAEEAIRAFHGSPYDFEQFDWSKIGTGEGAQAYGYGLYFAEVEDVAKDYRDALSKGDITITDSTGVKTKFPINPYGGEGDIADVLRLHDFETARNIVTDPNWLNNLPPNKQKDARELSELIGYAKGAEVSKGKMYEVAIKAKPDELLDWDKPLSEQSELVQSILGSSKFDSGKGVIARLSNRISDAREEGNDFWGELVKTIPDAKNKNSYELASKYLESKGIKGIRFKDQFSRNAEGGTSNFVVFDPRIIEIARKYGVALPVAGYILSQVEGQQQQQQPEA